MKRRPIMVMGCTSDAGKSFLVAALCRCLANRGVKVAPFKAQNMSNNAAVTADGGEIGRAQWLQARAARVEPSTRMNPVLLKPYADTASQVIVHGRPDPVVSALPWMSRRDRLWPVVHDSLNRLMDTHDCVVIEGAGSPAEVNLRAGDIVNMAVALDCGADVYLVADIDRGGAYAHLLGTWECLAPEERRLVRGFVLNKFRGDPTLLKDADDWLLARTGVPVVALMPYMRHRLPEEDAFFHRALPVEGTINIALVLYPWASNLDEFDPLIHEPGVSVVPVTDYTPLAHFRAVVLPGTKNAVASLRHLRATGLAAEVTRVAMLGIPVVGICGGMQMLGHAIHDPLALEGGDLDGLGLLDVATVLAAEKAVALRQTRWLDGGEVHGYEIHHGRTTPGPRAQPLLADDLGWQQENVWGTYLHGLFENTAFRQSFLRRLGWGGECTDWWAVVDAELERIALALEATGWPRAIMSL
ncbi:MAG: cobyric acid synthase [Polyangia bacterium]